MNVCPPAAPISGMNPDIHNIFNVQSLFCTNKVRVSRLGNLGEVKAHVETQKEQKSKKQIVKNQKT